MALGGFFGAFANILGGLATSSMQRSDNEYLMNKQADTYHMNLKMVN